MAKNIIQTQLHPQKIARTPAITKILEHCYAHPEVISLAGGIPDDQLFPVPLFAEALSGIAKSPSLRSGLQYNNRYGYAPLREWVVQYMKSLGVTCKLENILITHGAQQVIDLTGKHYVRPGDPVLAAEATYFAALQSLDTCYPQYKTSLHADLEAGVETSDGYHAALAYFVPDFDNPTGRTMDLAERRKTVALAQAHGFSILEDAAYASVRFEGEHLPSLLQLDIERTGDINKTCTIYGGTFSKSLVPGLRVGWACAAKPTIDAFADLLYAANLHVPPLTQMAAHQVATQIFDSHVKTICEAYRTRRDLMLAALEKHMPDGVSWNKPEGGMFIWVTLPERIDTKDLVWKALENGVAYAPAQDFSPHEKPASTLRLCYSWLAKEKIEPGIEILGTVIRQALKADHKVKHA